MVRLVPMTEADFAAFEEQDIRGYAAEQVSAGFWSASEAMERSRQVHEKLLPDGVATKDHYLYTIWEGEPGAAVGVLWMMAAPAGPRPSGFIYDIEVYEQYRGKGYARAAMLELEAIARRMGLRQLGLHVFAHNSRARALYEGLGYTVASLNMLKDL